MSVNLDEIIKRKREEIKRNIEIVTKAILKSRNADMKPPYYKVLHDTCDLEAWLCGGRICWNEIGERFTVDEKERVYDLARQVDGRVVFVEEQTD